MTEHIKLSSCPQSTKTRQQFVRQSPILLLNILNFALLHDFYTFLTEISSSSEPPKVAVVSSDNPDFWIGHLDLHIASKKHPLSKGQNAGQALHNLGSITHLLGEVSTMFIAEVKGRAVAGGSEFALNMDMRFAGPNARFGAVEVGEGLIHGSYSRISFILSHTVKNSEEGFLTCRFSSTKRSSLGSTLKTQC
jgi:enoyl-CoA hydratase/carnithine racemase